jgi:flagellin
MLSIQTNVTSLFAQQALANNSNFESKTIQQLTSGYRINSSGDDAAGLAVANQYRANIAELQQGVLNASNGSTTLQIIDGGLNNISQILDRLQTLATESASGTFSGNRATLDSEYQTLLTEITRQANNIGLATGGSATGSSKYNTSALQVFIGGGDTQGDSAVNVDLTNATIGVSGVDVTGLGLNGTSVQGGATPTTNAGLALTAITTAIANLGTVQGAVGGGENLLNYATSLANSQITNLSSAEASIRDADIASAAANLTKAQTLQQSSIAALAQANTMPAAVLKLLQ